MLKKISLRITTGISAIAPKKLPILRQLQLVMQWLLTSKLLGCSCGRSPILLLKVVERARLSQVKEYVDKLMLN
ncbi:hypothetical protein H6F93_06510 [Leptolyngbya sp. FACHB-671]|uniref:hypothetical protein n=1 Tax=Leptolyngbya sp. FACHB-671 TaxID=2692812 RepID=UPI001685C66A|nr:hypothetical protein [Leptolyngbya sp. FACHB-671]MBD1868297.1 hypothetical protein [Cyanobacteria bacterium FACHB-471]MBD2067182.1 hypothetical protein [Leptolyngbya sp. FACHB-671]